MDAPTPATDCRNGHPNGHAGAAPAYAIGHITVRDPAGWADYCSRVPATLAPWQGEVLLRGQTDAVFAGAYDRSQTVVLRFPDIRAASGWHASPAYQALIPLRDAAADVTLVSYQGQGAA